MALAAIFPTKFAIKPLFYRQSNPGDVISNALLLSNSQRELEETYQQGFFVDAAEVEDYDFSANISRHPIEKGLKPTDSIELNPIGIALTLRHTDTPIKVTDVFSGIGTSIGAQVGQKVGPLAAQVGGVAAGALTGMLRNGQGNQRTRSKSMYDQFISLWQNKAVLTIQTGLSIYRDMAIQRVSINRTPGVGKSLRFTVYLSQIRVVSSEIIEVDTPIKELNVSDKNKPQSDRGRQSLKTVDESKGSILKQIFG